MANLLSTNVSGRLYVSTQSDVNSTGGAFRFYDGSTFRGGLGLDDWAHAGSAANITMYVSGDNNFFISTSGVKRAQFNSSAALFRTYSADTAYNIRITGGDQFNAYYNDSAATLYLQYHNGNGGTLNVANGKLTVNTSGSVVSSGDMRAPIFYDSNDTTYYFDGNSTTSLRTKGSWRADSADWDGEYAGKIQYHSNHWYFQSGNLWIFRNSGGGNIFTVDQSGNGSFSGTVTSNTLNVSDTNARYYFQSANGVPSNNLGNPTVTEMALFDEQFNNKTAFYNPDALSFWTSSDGVNFTEYTGFDTTTKKRFLGGDTDSGVSIPNLTNRFRIELENTAGYVFLNQLYIYWSSNSHSTKVHIWVRRCDNNQWYQWTDSNTQVSSWPGHLYLPFSGIPFYPGALASSGHYNRIRIEFIPSWSGHPTYGSNAISLMRMQIWGGYPAGKRNIYSTDENRNVTFPSNVYSSSGKLATESYVTSQGYISANQTITLSGDVSGSGTTSIAVTVNNIDGWGFVNTGGNSETNADTINSNGISYYTGGVTNFSGNATDGALYSQRYSDSWQHQIAGDYRSGMIAVRGKNNGTWTSWKTIIDSSTIGSQSVNYASSAGNSDTVDGYHESAFWRDGQDRTIGALRFSGNGGNSGNGGIAYGIFQEGGDWTHPYPDLRIAFHTGIKLGANAGYEGIRFYTDYDMSSQVMSVNNGSDPLGQGNVYVNNSLQAGSSLRAPIFYDSQNTGYYGDFASTSVMNAIRLGTSTNNGTISGGADWGIRFANDNGWIQFGPANNSWTHIYTDKDFYFNQNLYVNGTQVVLNSGTWSINISGNAGSATSATTASSSPLLSALADYVFTASTNGRSFSRGIQTSFVSASEGYPQYGSVVRIATYSGTNDGGTAELYFPYSATYGGSSMRYRLGLYSNAGWTGWKTVIDSDNIGSQSVSYADESGFAASAGSVEWTSVQNKPATFSPSSHTHAISDVTGLQTALDGKQASGSYAAASHTHAIADVTGLQAALDGKQAAGSYAAASHTHTFASLTSKPTTISGYGITDAITTGNIGSQSVSSASGVSITGFGTDSFTYHQTPGNVHGWTGGWASHFIGNHGNGDTYYSQSIIMPFWGVPRYQRNEGGNKVGPWQFITEENIATQSVSFATTSGSATSSTTANRLDNYGINYGSDWNTWGVNGKLVASSYHNASGANKPPTYTYGSFLSFLNSGADSFQIAIPENQWNGTGKERAMHFRSAWNGTWSSWRQVVDIQNNICDILADGTSTLIVRQGVGYNQPFNSNIEIHGSVDDWAYGKFRFRVQNESGTEPVYGAQFRIERFSVNTGWQLLGMVPRGSQNLEWQGDILPGLSDQRVKENVVSLTDGVATVQQINPVEFDWKPVENVSEREGHDIGFIAQQLEEIVPTAVHTRSDGYKTVKYEKVVPILVQAIKEQQSMIEQLSARLSALEQK